MLMYVLSHPLRTGTINGAPEGFVCLSLRQFLHALRTFVRLRLLGDHGTRSIILQMGLLFRVVKRTALAIAVQFTRHGVDAISLYQNIFDSHGPFHHR